MPAITLQHLREEQQRLGGFERTKRQEVLFEKMRADAVAVIALASKILNNSGKKRLEALLEEMRVTSTELRATFEGDIANGIVLADEAVRMGQAAWEAVIKDPTRDRVNEGKMVRVILRDAERVLGEVLGRAQEHATIFQQPLARLEELETRAKEFPLWTREYLARWEILYRPAPTLDPEQVAQTQAAYARGEYENLDDVLNRFQAGGPWVKV